VTIKYPSFVFNVDSGTIYWTPSKKESVVLKVYASDTVNNVANPELNPNVTFTISIL
jgi:hypothetical protein